jgi:hypothetical protein
MKLKIRENLHLYRDLVCAQYVLPEVPDVYGYIPNYVNTNFGIYNYPLSG